MGFRENLKAELHYSGMLVKELSAKTGIKKHTLDNYLSVRGRMPAADVAVRIAQALNVSVEYLITGAESPTPKGAAQFSPEVRHLARIAESLTPNFRKLATYAVEILKKYEDAGTG